jgi:methionyl aminopeptidase
MICEGTHEVEMLEDGWTAVTRDRRRAAHFEHSVAVTADGPEVLTLPA